MAGNEVFFLLIIGKAYYKREEYDIVLYYKPVIQFDKNVKERSHYGR
jgi:hypothetical protein